MIKENIIKIQTLMKEKGIDIYITKVPAEPVNPDKNLRPLKYSPTYSLW